MNYIPPGGVMNKTDLALLAKISDFIHLAHSAGWKDLIIQNEKIGEIKKRSHLKRHYYKLVEQAKLRGYVPAKNQLQGAKIVPVAQIKTTPTPTTNPTSTPTPPTPPSMNNTQINGSASHVQEKTSSLDGGEQSIPRPGEFAGDPLLTHNVIERDYTKSQPGAGMNEHIPEPDATQPPPPPPPGGMPEDATFENISDLPPGEKAKAARDMAKILVDLYGDKIPEIFRWAGRISENQIVEFQRTGQIDFKIELNVPVPTPRVISIGQYIHEFNESINTEFGVPEEWKAELLPYVVEILKKRGMGMTPEQMVMYMVGVDLATKAVALFGIKRALTSNLEFWMNETAERRKRGDGPGPHYAAPSPAPASAASSSPAGEKDKADDIANVEFTEMPTAAQAVSEPVRIISVKGEEVDDDGNNIDK